MGVFNPTLEPEVVYQQPIQAPKQYNPLTDIANLASSFAKEYTKTPSASDLTRQQLAKFGTELSRAMDLREQGKPFKSTADNAAIALITSGVSDVPDELKELYKGITGVDFDSIGYKNEDEYDKQQILESDNAISLRLALKATNPNLKPEELDTKVLDMINEAAYHKQALDLQNSRISLGLPVESTPVIESLQNDFSILTAQIAQYVQDGIVTQKEILEASSSVRALVASKYSMYKENPKVQSIITEMNGLIDDISKYDADKALLDAIHISLSKTNYNPFTIATIRGMIKLNPTEFKDNILDKLQEEDAKGKTWIDGLSQIMGDTYSDVELENFFTKKPEVASVTGKETTLLEVPNVDKDPEVYSNIIDGMSGVTSLTKPTDIINKEDVRDTWLNTVNLLSNLVYQQSGEYVLGEDLLNLFASNGIVNNLEAVYKIDPLNAGQTNDLLLKALSSEYTRQEMALNTRLAKGDSEYLKVDPDTQEIKLDLTPFENNIKDEKNPSKKRNLQNYFDALSKSVQKIEEVGGVEYFFNLPENRRRELIEATPIIERFFSAKLNDSFKLNSNLKLIRTKEAELTKLKQKYEKSSVVFDPEIDDLLKDTENALAKGLGPNAVTSPEIGIVAKNRPEVKEVPYKFTGKTDEEQEAEFEALSKDTLFIDPDTGLLARKN